MRLIEADALIEKLEAWKKEAERIGANINYIFASAIIAQVNEQPTIEERKTGKWIEYDSDEDKYDIIKCSCCNHTFTVDSFHWTDIGFTKNDFNFCPNCGADMRGVEE